MTGWGLGGGGRYTLSDYCSVLELFGLFINYSDEYCLFYYRTTYRHYTGFGYMLERYGAGGGCHLPV